MWTTSEVADHRAAQQDKPANTTQSRSVWERPQASIALMAGKRKPTDECGVRELEWADGECLTNEKCQGVRSSGKPQGAHHQEPRDLQEEKADGLCTEPEEERPQENTIQWVEAEDGQHVVAAITGPAAACQECPVAALLGPERAEPQIDADCDTDQNNVDAGNADDNTRQHFVACDRSLER